MIAKYTIVTILLLCLFSFSQNAFAQGCSDAGLCTLPEMKLPLSGEPSGSQATNRLMVGLSLGQGNRSIDVLTPFLAYGRKFSEAISASAKLTYSSASGELGDHAGLGDLFVSADYIMSRSNVNALFLTIGAKIPLSKADAGDGIISLPMDYQSSLETCDLLLGAGYSRGPLTLHFGWQQPLTSKISNDFLAPRYPDARALNYSSTNQYSRKADALLRISYDWKIAPERFSVRPSILPIFHIANDSYLDSLGVENEIADSRGMTVNGNIFLTYKITRMHELELSYGMPFITRDVRPDGLTREFVLGLEYHFMF